MIHAAVSNSENQSQSSIIGSLAKGTFKLAHATTLAVSGVGLMMIGGYSSYLLYQQTNKFYWAEGDKAGGYADIPGFNKTCTALTEFIHRQTGYPEPDSPFCDTLGSKPFDEQGIYGPAALASSLGISLLGSLAALYTFLGGVALIGKSVDVYTSAIFK